MDHLKKQEKDRETPQISEAEECTDRRMPQISEAEEYCVRIAGLCHDLGMDRRVDLQNASYRILYEAKLLQK